MIDTASYYYQERFKLWVSASFKFMLREDPHIMREIQELGAAERLLLELESRSVEVTARHLQAVEQDIESLTLLTEYAAHSKLWVLGLYEVLRNVREWRKATPDAFSNYAKLYSIVDELRIALAKHEVKAAGKHSKSERQVLYPPVILESSKGWVGWRINARVVGLVDIYRTDLANTFLEIAASENPAHR